MQPVVLLAASTWWPLSAQLAISLRDHGCCIETLCPPGHPLRHVRGMRRHHLYRSFGSMGALRRALFAAEPAVIVPCDDAVVWQLHQLYQDEPRLRGLISRSLGSATHFDTVSSRERLLQVAHELHIRVPRTVRVQTQEELRRNWECFKKVVVLKQDGTWGGNGVRVVRSMAEADREYARMQHSPSRTTAYKRMMINHDPLALWIGRNLKKPVVTMQEFIPGRPANLMMACWQGEVLGAITVEVLWSHGATGAAMVVRLIDHPEIAMAACALARKLELSGFHGVDFMLAKSGAAYLIELNPRCTQLGHLPMAGWGNLARLLGKRLGAEAKGRLEEPMQPGLTVGDTIAFFPKAVLSKPGIAYVRDGYQDTPWGEPELMRELLRDGWPDRQWLARLYHLLRPPKQDQPNAFEDAALHDDLGRANSPYVGKQSEMN